MIDGLKLKELRKAKDLNQQELGDAMGVTKVSICCYEKGTRTPALELYFKLVDFFDIDANYLRKK